MKQEENDPWIDSTRKQVASMRNLVEDMVYLSRADETDRPLQTEVLNLKDLVPEMADPA